MEWHNPYSDKLIDSLEYLPRETSKPTHEYAYSKYYDLENNAQKVVDNMIQTYKRRRAENHNNFEKRIKKINDLNDLIESKHDLIESKQDLIESKQDLIESKQDYDEKILKYAGYIRNFFYYGLRISVVIAVGSIIYMWYI